MVTRSFVFCKPFWWRSLRFPTGEAEVNGPKNFYKTGGPKTYIPKHFYTKTTYSPLLSEKFGGSAAPSRPLKASPMNPPTRSPLFSTIVNASHHHQPKAF
ncbi:hypothetical protein Hanom_Chr03g00231831 [Helianthus anomalus]